MTNNRLERRNAVGKLIQDRPDNLLIVAGLGSAVWDIEATSEHEGNFFMLGAMGAVVSTALGLALAQPNKMVAAFTGDAELAMGLYSLATVAWRNPKNLSIICWDNGHFGETGGQASHSQKCLNLSGIAASSGFERILTIENEEGIDTLRDEMKKLTGPLFGHVMISSSMPPVVMPIRHGCVNATIFRRYVLGHDALKK
jgi:Thiamine pyrophosphate-requiring enzymes [acetolactate synthase, pyruvate dehydrogenase (cytochrome), glyoxylate carboligase, phosphonopyruvate decarboxylase]